MALAFLAQHFPSTSTPYDIAAVSASYSDNEPLQQLHNLALAHKLAPYLIAKYAIEQDYKKETRQQKLLEAMDEFSQFLEGVQDLPELATISESPRDQKIRIYREQKQLQERIDGALSKYQRGNAASRLEKNNTTQETTIELSPEDDDDNDDIRALVFDALKFARNEARTELTNIKMELKLLEKAKQADHNVLQPKQFNYSPQEQRRKEAEDNNKTSMRLDMVTPKTKLVDKNGKPLQPFTITQHRQKLQSGVFRPGHNLPTMSLDQFLDNERARGNILQGGNNEMSEPAYIDDNDENALESDRIKTSDFDDFKDANPKGWGNRDYNRG